MRLLRYLAILAGVVLLGLSVVTGVQSNRSRSADSLDARLDLLAKQQVRTIESTLERSSAVILQLANAPSFLRFAEAAGSTNRKVNRQIRPVVESQAALAYIREIVPRGLGAASFVDVDGREVARVVDGRHVPPDELERDVSASPPLEGIADLAPSEVLHTRPYVSSTGAWVFSTATRVVDGSGNPAGVVQFELELDSFRGATIGGGLSWVILDGTTGRIIVDSDRPLPSGSADLASYSAQHPQAELLAQQREFGVASVGDQRIGLERVRSARGNENKWVVAVASPHVDAGLAGAFGPMQIALVSAALLMMALGGLSLRAYQRYLRLVAVTDPLTGLANRALLRERLREAVSDGREEGQLSAVALIDLDRFKEVNDNLGRDQGDAVLREVGARLQQAVRPGDTVARLGGDEFALVIPALESIGEADVRIQQVRGKLAAPLVLDGVPLQIDASIGIAVAPLHGDDAEQLLRRADIAMYLAKREQLPFSVYDGTDEDVNPRRLAMVPELRAAIENGDIEVHFQPKVQLSTGAVHGVEALARWNHPEFGRVPPMEFVALAEETGLIRELTADILRQSLAHCRSWRNVGIELPVAVNLSMRNLFDEEFILSIGQRLERSGVPPALLEFEITESAVMSDTDKALEAIGRLRELGVGISLDDFGTGHSSLAHLQRLPVDQLKIDRSFVVNMANNEKDAFIVRSTVTLGKDLGLRIVAEGVEDDLSAGLLEKLGCDFAQGRLISDALPSDELIRWLLGHADEEDAVSVAARSGVSGHAQPQAGSSEPESEPEPEVGTPGEEPVVPTESAAEAVPAFAAASQEHDEAAA